MQSTAESRPKQANKEVEFGGGLYLRLEISVCPHRLVLPKIRSDFQEAAEFNLKPVKDLPYLFPLCPHIARRGDKNANCFHLTANENFYSKQRTPTIFEKMDQKSSACELDSVLIYHSIAQIL